MSDRHLPLNWRAPCPSPYTPPDEKWPPCGTDCECRSECEAERAEYDARFEDLDTSTDEEGDDA